MKKIITISIICCFINFIQAQNDSTQFIASEFKFQLDSLKENIESNYNKIIVLEEKNFNSKNSILDSLKKQNKIFNDFIKSINKINVNQNKFLYEIKTLKEKINSLDNLYNTEIEKIKDLIKLNNDEISLKQKELNKKLSASNSEAKSNIENLNAILNTKSNLAYFFIFLGVLIALTLFYVLRKRFTFSTKKIESEQLKLDQKLIELYDLQLSEQNKEIKNSSKQNDEIDHTLALKVGDEIIRMKKNLYNMPDDTRGVRQLSKALQRIQDTFKVNGYEMVEMLNKPYVEGMKVVVNFITDENLEKGKQIITKIIKPQINFNGKMIQSAQIEVSVGQ
ncbi:MAG: hypothetical protein CMG00_06440 [Candidatus Marinimicrobia bacterium]|nr:hypothetical protein [Candidatus Neomarinimicrobiota bacterium]